jgi:hypothetical protein
MITNTSTTDLKNAPGESPVLPPPRHQGPDGHSAPPIRSKPKKRGFIWMLLLLVVVGVAVYAVWRAGQPGLIVQPQTGRGRGRNAAGLGPQPVVVTKAKRINVPVYLTGLGNVAAFYTVTVKTRVDGQLMSVAFNEGDNVKEEPGTGPDRSAAVSGAAGEQAEGAACARPGAAGRRPTRSESVAHLYSNGRLRRR